MRKIIHIEDEREWREVVSASLASSKNIEPIVAFNNMEDFRNANYPGADLYICDRHIPDKRGDHPDDRTWKGLLDTISCLHPYSSVVIFSSHPPANLGKYKNVVNAVPKPLKPEDLDFGYFREVIEHHLGLNWLSGGK